MEEILIPAFKYLKPNAGQDLRADISKGSDRVTGLLQIDLQAMQILSTNYPPIYDSQRYFIAPLQTFTQGQ